MKHRIAVSVVAAAAALAAAPAYASQQEYQPFQTDFPSSSQVNGHFVPGVTDFPRTAPTVSQSTIAADDGDVAWSDAGVLATISAVLGLGLAGSALLLRRRSTLAHT